MALASRIWDNPPSESSPLKLVGFEKDDSARFATLFNAPTVNPVTLVKPAGRLNKSSAVSQLVQLKDLPFDWNGYGAQPIDVELIEQAKRIVEELPADIIETPSVVPMTRGRLQLEWHRGNRSLELEFESKGRIHYLKADDDSGIDEENILLTDQMIEIKTLLRWFSSE